MHLLFSSKEKFLETEKLFFLHIFSIKISQLKILSRIPLSFTLTPNSLSKVDVVTLAFIRVCDEAIRAEQ